MKRGDALGRRRCACSTAVCAPWLHAWDDRVASCCHVLSLSAADFAPYTPTLYLGEVERGLCDGAGTSHHPPDSRGGRRIDHLSIVSQRQLSRSAGSKALSLFSMKSPDSEAGQ